MIQRPVAKNGWGALFDLGRLQRFQDEFLRIGAPPDDVDLFVIELANYVFHPRTAHAYARADRIDLFVRAPHR